MCLSTSFKKLLSTFEIFYYCITRTVTVKKGVPISRHAHKVSCSCSNLNDPLHSYSPFWALFQCSGRSLSNWSLGTKWFNSIALPYIRDILLLTRDSNRLASLMILKDIESWGQSKQEFRLIVFWVCPKAVKLNLFLWKQILSNKVSVNWWMKTIGIETVL